MKIIELEDILRNRNDGTGLFTGPGSAVCIGKFDGVHRGHVRLFEAIREYKRKGLCAVALGFDRLIPEYFTGRSGKLLSPRDEWKMLMEEQGIDTLAVYPVTEESMGISPESFVKDVLTGILGMKAVAAGPDCSFGAGGRGSIDTLRTLGGELKFETVCVPKVLEDDGSGNVCEISSSLIKRILGEGNVKQAATLLGRPYSFTGSVVEGKKTGRTLGMPTANLRIPEDKFVPLSGVYISESLVGGKRYPSLTNIGTNPTVGGDRLCIETWISGFSGDIYGEDMEVSLLDYLRPEKRFDSLSQLKEQLCRDRSAILQ